MPLKYRTIRELAEAAYTPEQFEYLLKDASFRLMLDSDSEDPYGFEDLCRAGESLLAERENKLPIKRRKP